MFFFFLPQPHITKPALHLIEPITPPSPHPSSSDPFTNSLPEPAPYIISPIHHFLLHIKTFPQALTKTAGLPFILPLPSKPSPLWPYLYFHQRILSPNHFHSRAYPACNKPILALIPIHEHLQNPIKDPLLAAEPFHQPEPLIHP